MSDRNRFVRQLTTYEFEKLKFCETKEQFEECLQRIRDLRNAVLMGGAPNFYGNTNQDLKRNIKQLLDYLVSTQYASQAKLNFTLGVDPNKSFNKYIETNFNQYSNIYTNDLVPLLQPQQFTTQKKQQIYKLKLFIKLRTLYNTKYSGNQFVGEFVESLSEYSGLSDDEIRRKITSLEGAIDIEAVAALNNNRNNAVPAQNTNNAVNLANDEDDEVTFISSRNRNTNQNLNATNATAQRNNNQGDEETFSDTLTRYVPRPDPEMLNYLKEKALTAKSWNDFLYEQFGGLTYSAFSFLLIMVLTYWKDIATNFNILIYDKWVIISIFVVLLVEIFGIAFFQKMFGRFSDYVIQTASNISRGFMSQPQVRLIRNSIETPSSAATSTTTTTTTNAINTTSTTNYSAIVNPTTAVPMMMNRPVFRVPNQVGMTRPFPTVATSNANVITSASSATTFSSIIGNTQTNTQPTTTTTSTSAENDAFLKEMEEILRKSNK